jgi:bifunctional ADP-heptose synthase (sugar kinase/adenylyltransferase)
VEAGGGRVGIVPFVEGLSTTDIVARVRERYCK